MSEIPDDLFYTADHEWLRIADGVAVIGITDHAQEALTDIVYVELPDSGGSFKTGDEFASVESVKSVSGIFAPLDGEVTSVNEALDDAPELINEDPYGEGWIVEFTISSTEFESGLLTAADYKAEIGE
jgi:glycine cleavage system H protein